MAKKINLTIQVNYSTENGEGVMPDELLTALYGLATRLNVTVETAIPGGSVTMTPQARGAWNKSASGIVVDYEPGPGDKWRGTSRYR